VRRDGVHILMEPQPVRPVPGRFLVTAVLVLEGDAVGRLDPRGAKPPTSPLDELETARFLTNLRRLAKRMPASVAVATNEYRVVA
jgi:hypothetical protein